ncbi:MAG: nucleotidyltransferase family protein [Pyrinomonadaceae bacterium]|nr:nucleotidyltransferase family protein [Pyrinomonadaceae bacterium]
MQFSEETKAKIVELCKKNKVRELSLFGSRARGDERPDSDFDLLVEFLPDSGIGLIEYSRMQIDLSEILETNVDLVTKKGLKEYVRDHVLADATPIYEA